MNDILIAKRLLEENGYTAVLYADGEAYHSRERGVAPLLRFLESGKSFRGFSAADKTVGAGAAHLYTLLGVSSVWAGVLSEAGERILTENGIAVTAEERVPYIINRAGDGVCPIERAVKDIRDPHEALAAIKKTLAALAGRKNL